MVKSNVSKIIVKSFFQAAATNSTSYGLSPRDHASGTINSKFLYVHFNFQFNFRERYVYGGCGGSRNRFVSEADCRRVCAEHLVEVNGGGGGRKVKQKKASTKRTSSATTSSAGTTTTTSRTTTTVRLLISFLKKARGGFF